MDCFKELSQKSFENILNPLSANPTKWSNILKQFVGDFIAIFNTESFH